ncbi:MAG: LysR family transcriptional regulator [Alphaproteobacteria bacterium]|nr:LysR family transcriptional regulator [Alphaproteobacteria bacterium]
MNFNQIRFFLAVAETLNFTSAAEACAVSQPALSKAIRNLEESLGAALLTRNTQHVELTEFGRTMRIHFERIEENRRRALDAAKLATKAATEPLNVGVMCTIGPRRFSEFLEKLHKTNPHIEVTLHDVTPPVIPHLLLSGGLDCVFCAREAKHDQRFEAIDLFNEHMVVAFADGHRFADMESVALAEIAKEPYLDRLHCEFRDEFLDFTKGSGLELDVVLRSERDDWVLELLRRGLGVSVIPANSIILNDVQHRPICDLTSHRSLELVTTRNEDMAPALEAFRDAAKVYDWR